VGAGAAGCCAGGAGHGRHADIGAGVGIGAVVRVVVAAVVV